MIGLRIIAQGAVVAAALAFAPVAVQAATLIGISTPVGSNDATSRPSNEGVWSVSGTPAPTTIGIGWTVDLSQAGNYGSGNFVKHDHQYTGPFVPDPTRAQITFQFSNAVTLNMLSMIEHTNGISRVHAYLGNNLNALTDLGEVVGSLGEGQFFDGAVNDFAYNSAASGSYLTVVFSRSSISNGYAFFRLFPSVTDVQQGGVPEPATWAMMIIGFAGTGAALRRRRAPTACA